MRKILIDEKFYFEEYHFEVAGVKTEKEFKLTEISLVKQKEVKK